MLTAKLWRASAVSLMLVCAPVLRCVADERQSLEELRNTVVNLLQALVDQGVISREKAEQMVKSAQDKAAANAATAAKGTKAPCACLTCRRSSKTRLPNKSPSRSSRRRCKRRE